MSLGPRTFTMEVFYIVQKEQGEFTAASLRERHQSTRSVLAWQTALTRLKNLYLLNWRWVHPDKPAKRYLVYSRSVR